MSTGLEESYRATASLLRVQGIRLVRSENKSMGWSDFMVLKDYLAETAIKVAAELDAKADALGRGKSQ